MTRAYTESLALAAREIVVVSDIDIAQPVLPLAKRMMEETGCSIDTAKRHIARAIRVARGETIGGTVWGGTRSPHGGRPKQR